MDISQSTNPAAGLGASRTCGQLGGKYMTFKLAGEEYGLEILKVLEIIRLMEITPAPRMREHFRGIINLRGNVVTVIDVRSHTQIKVIPVGKAPHGMALRAEPKPARGR